jgi:hypothetical protein
MTVLQRRISLLHYHAAWIAFAATSAIALLLPAPLKRLCDSRTALLMPVYSEPDQHDGCIADDG